MGLYQPRNLTPYLQCIDGSKVNTFSCQISGTKCTGYNIQILTTDNNIIFGADGGQIILPKPLYNDNILSYNLPEGILTNGQDYKWRIRLYQENPTMMIGYGTVTGCKSDSIAIQPPTEAEDEVIKNTKYKHLRIDKKTQPVSTYDSTLHRFTMAKAFSWNTIADGTKVEVLDSDEDGEPNDVIYTGVCVNSTNSLICMKPNTYTLVGQQMKIGGVIYHIAEFDNTTWRARVVPNLDTIPTWGTEYEVYSDFIDSNPEAPFYVRSNANVKITNITNGQVITNKNYEFLGSYSQAENVEMKFYKWKLWVVDENSVESLIEETKDTYSADIRFNFNEFRTGLIYKIQLIVEDEYDRKFETPIVSFNIDYAQPDINVTPVATFLPDKTAINVQWGNTVTYEPVITPQYYKYVYSNNTYTVSNIPNKVFDLYTNELVSATVHPEATLVTTAEITEHSIINGLPFLGVKSLKLPAPETITWSEWTKEDRVGIMDLPEDFCVSWYQKFEETFVGDIIKLVREDDNGAKHTYKVWITEETDLQNKYKFLYNLDGKQGAFVWDTRAQNFCLQYSKQANPEEDYIYADTLNNQQQTWIDDKYFVESGTRGKRLNKYWWKFVMTKDTLTVQRGSD